MTTEELLNERSKTHGDWANQSGVAQSLKSVLRSVPGYNDRLTSGQREALDMICVKMARIVCGDPNETDHWADGAGYFILGVKPPPKNVRSLRDLAYDIRKAMWQQCQGKGAETP